MRVDLNADLGEGIGDDAAMLALVSSASIACGGHAGDEATMREAVRHAVAHRVRIGAHPSYPDREHFGRRPLTLDPTTLRTLLTEQVRSLAQIAHDGGAHVSYLKPHGALYNTAMTHDAVATVVLDVAETALATPMPVMCLPGSRLRALAIGRGIATITEGFADRAMRPDGTLVPRSQPGAVLHEPEQIAARVVELAGRVESICLHGDTPGAVELARAARRALESAGVDVSVDVGVDAGVDVSSDAPASAPDAP